jgi:hypothetical protein
VKNVLAWLKDHAGLVAIVALGVVGFVLARFFGLSPRPLPTKLIQQELKAIDAGAKAAKDAVERGADNAVKTLEAQHASTIAQLDEAQRAKADRLRADPRSLAKYLGKLSDKG